MAVAIPGAPNVRVLLQVGDDPELVELGVIEAPGISTRPLAKGAGVELVLDARRWRRSIRRFFRAVARAV